MKEIKEIRKKDIPLFLEDLKFWNHSFLPISKHRLWAHFHNPSCSPEDIVMLLAYIDNELVGYIGVYTDFIAIEERKEKIGWLSTWWVHPKTKGSGIGRMLLDTMFDKRNGQIGISQFTESAKRVYDKSGYFTELKNSVGIKAVLRSNLSFIFPVVFPKLKFLKPLFNFTDSIFNLFINVRLQFCKHSIQKKLSNISLEYLPFPDVEARELINTHNQRDLSYKSDAFFHWLKTYNWVYEAPLVKMTHHKDYEFSMYDSSFEFYFIKVRMQDNCIAFLVLQKRATTLKVLFSYFDNKLHGQRITDLIKQHALALKIREIICYEPTLVNHLSQSTIFLYKKRRIKHSIISKSFEIKDLDKIRVQFGDGDCCFA